MLTIGAIAGLILVGILVGGVLYLRHKLATVLGGSSVKGDLRDLSRSVALPMMDDQWLGERRSEGKPSEATESRRHSCCG